jgi:hypothetical protein
MRLTAALALTITCGLLGCCSGNPSSPSPAKLPNGGTTADLTFCVTETNRYRAVVGRAALTETASVETFATAAAQSDTQSGIPHGYYNSHIPGFSAENEAPEWLITSTIQNTIAAAIAAFWSEGPSGAHYQNMVGPYTQLGCGLFVLGQSVTIVQDYR